MLENNFCALILEIDWGLLSVETIRGVPSNQVNTVFHLHIFMYNITVFIITCEQDRCHAPLISKFYMARNLHTWARAMRSESNVFEEYVLYLLKIICYVMKILWHYSGNRRRVSRKSNNYQHLQQYYRHETCIHFSKNINTLMEQSSIL